MRMWMVDSTDLQWEERFLLQDSAPRENFLIAIMQDRQEMFMVVHCAALSHWHKKKTQCDRARPRFILLFIYFFNRCSLHNSKSDWCWCSALVCVCVNRSVYGCMEVHASLKQNAHVCSFPPARCLYSSYSSVCIDRSGQWDECVRVYKWECVSSHSEVRSSPRGEGDGWATFIVHVHGSVCAREPGARIRVPFPLPLSETLDVALKQRERRVRIWYIRSALVS